MEKETNNFGIGLFFGIVVGALAGILLAPNTGEETRRKLMDTSEDIQNNLKTLSSKVRKETEEMIQKGKDFVKEIEKNTDKKIHSMEEKIEDVISDEEEIV
jgi:gas vesicle protein